MQEAHLNIVLIDDHQLLTDSLSNLLSGYSFINDITVFRNPKEYLKVEKKLDTDIVITDILMPEMSGIDLLLEIKKK